MQVILRKTYPSLGLVGDIVNVAPGYFRNFLEPRKIAFKADPANINQFEHRKRIVGAKKLKEKVEAQAVKANIEKTSIKIVHAAGENGRLFGSVTTQEIAVELKKAGFDVDRRQMNLDKPIKNVGDYKVALKLHPEVSADIQLTIEAKEVVSEVSEKEAPKKKRVSKKEAKKAEEASDLETAATEDKASQDNE